MMAEQPASMGDRAAKQKVVITLPVLLVGGTEMQTVTLTRVLVEAGYDVVVCCYYDHDAEMVGAMKAAGSKVVLLNENWANGLYRLLIRLIRFFREQSPDFVHVQYMAPGFVPVLAARLAGVKRLFATVHQPGRTYGLKAKILLRTAARMSMAFFCISRAVETSWFGRGRSKHHCVIYNAVDIGRIGKAAEDAGTTDLKESLGIKGRMVVGCVGRLRWEKGQQILLEAMTEVIRTAPEVVLILVGDGPDRDRLREAAEKLGVADRILWLGAKEQGDVFRLFSVMDVVVVPSLFEGFGLVAAEAMAAGKPVVASDVDGLREVVEHRRGGLLVPAGDSEALAVALTELLLSPEQRKTMGTLARQSVSRFSVESFRKVLLGAYRSLSAAPAK